jgi:hypothetical protein
VLSVTTKTIKGTQCSGPNPTVKLRVHDIDPIQTDEFDGTYAVVPYVVDDYENSHMTTTSDENAASLFVLAENGNLKTGPDLIANVDYFGGFELPYFTRKASIKLHNFYPIKCAPTVADHTLLGCSVDNGFDNLTMLVTCPEYNDYFNTPFVLGDQVPRDAPVCNQFLFRIIPVCTPK